MFLRDSIAFKIGYAYGLRRRELVMLDLTDFGPNPHVPRYGNYGALTVRWAKGTKGSGPRRLRAGVRTRTPSRWRLPLPSSNTRAHSALRPLGYMPSR
jgi:hypothetical protein